MKVIAFLQVIVGAETTAHGQHVARRQLLVEVRTDFFLDRRHAPQLQKLTLLTHP